MKNSPEGDSKRTNTNRKIKVAHTPEAREQQLIALAVDAAEEQLRSGKASSQVIVHYLKLGSTKERQEREKAEEEIKLLRAKTEALQSAKHIEELYSNAIVAMRKYNGQSNDEEEE